MSELQNTQRDLVFDSVAAWIDAETKREAMVREWQRLEHAVMLKCRAKELDFAWACRSRMAEARAMRLLMKRIRSEDRRLEAEAGRVSVLVGQTAEAALSKIRLGLRVQGSYDWRPYALELLEGGVGELARLLDRTG